MNEVRPERSGWRDDKISARHRLWGWDCPAVDIDFILCEYNKGLPVALIEYKHKDAQLPNMGNPSIMALADLATNYSKGPLPCFIAVYCNVHWWFKIIPLNSAAEKIYPNATSRNLSEKRYVASLYYMRNIKLTESQDESWLKNLNNLHPNEVAV